MPAKEGGGVRVALVDTGSERGQQSAPLGGGAAFRSRSRRRRRTGGGRGGALRQEAVDGRLCVQKSSSRRGALVVSATTPVREASACAASCTCSSAIVSCWLLAFDLGGGTRHVERGGSPGTG